MLRKLAIAVTIAFLGDPQGELVVALFVVFAVLAVSLAAQVCGPPGGGGGGRVVVAVVEGGAARAAGGSFSYPIDMCIERGCGLGVGTDIGLTLNFLLASSACLPWPYHTSHACTMAASWAPGPRPRAAFHWPYPSP